MKKELQSCWQRREKGTWAEGGVGQEHERRIHGTMGVGQAAGAKSSVGMERLSVPGPLAPTVIGTMLGRLKEVWKYCFRH